jgi:hypothetical protein
LWKVYTDFCLTQRAKKGNFARPAGKLSRDESAKPSFVSPGIRLIRLAESGNRAPADGISRRHRKGRGPPDHRLHCLTNAGYPSMAEHHLHESEIH